MYQDITTTALSWGLYFFIHSALASAFCKDWVHQNIPFFHKNYRLLYNGFSIFGLIPILYFLAATPSVFLFERTNITKYLALMLATWGVIIIKTAFKTYNTRKFLGIEKAEYKSEFVRNGLLNYMRHPIYTGTILMTIGFWLFIPNALNLITALCVFIYLAIGIRLEERKLLNEFGEVYETFKKEVPMLFPNPSKLFSIFRQ